MCDQSAFAINILESNTPSGPPSGVPPISVRCADGILFTAAAYPATPELVNEQVQGTIHWQDVEFTEMENFQKVLTNQNSGGSVNVVDFSNNTAVMDFVRWLKKQPQWFGTNATT